MEDIKKRIEYTENAIKFIEEQRFTFNADLKEMSKVNFFNFEKEIINAYEKNKFTLINKSRQMHLSSLTAAYCAWNLIFKENFCIGIMSTNISSASRFIDMIKDNMLRYKDSLYEWDKNVIRNNKNEISLNNGSTIRAITNYKTGFRGMTFNLVIFDEMAFINLSEEVLYTIIPSISAIQNSQCIVYSTPNGTNNTFYNLWHDGHCEKNEFKIIDLPWYSNPRYIDGLDVRNGKLWSPWYEKMCQCLNYDSEKIDMEFNCRFSNKKKPSSMRINLRIDSILYEKVSKKINENNTNLSDYIRKLIERDLES